MTAQIKHFEHQIGIFETRGEKAPNQQKEVMKLRIDGKRVQMQSGRGWNVIHLIELSKKESERKWTETMGEMRLSTVHVTYRDQPLQLSQLRRVIQHIKTRQIYQRCRRSEFKQIPIVDNLTITISK